jgi:hypothetical protein
LLYLHSEASDENRPTISWMHGFFDVFATKHAANLHQVIVAV